MPSPSRSREDTAHDGEGRAASLPAARRVAGPSLVLALALLLGGLVACSTSPTPPRLAEQSDAAWTERESAEMEALAAGLFDAEPPAAASVRVRLAFGAEADLDLFVSDPLQETVYFANDVSKSGGRLDVDRRCEAPAPRVETVTFEAAPTGRYRVGVDYPRGCEGRGPRRVPFAIAIEEGTRRTMHRGVISRGVFLIEVARFDFQP